MKLSIITINYNNKAGLEKTIASVMSQTWRDFEWILIDGGSTDGSKEIIEELAKNPAANISYCCSEKDKGVYNAMNKGIPHCSGDYICCMNGGDIFYAETTLQKVFSKVHTADIVYGDWLQIYADREEMIHAPQEMDISRLYHGNVCQQAMFVRTLILKEKGFDESYKLWADYRRWVTAAFDGATFEYLAMPICRYDTYGISNTQRDDVRVESKRLKTSFPPTVVSTINKYDKLYAEYFDNPYVQKAKKVEKQSGLKLLILRVVFKMLGV